jgi:hypothetical protein
VCEREIGRDKEREGGKEKYLANVIFVSREGHKNGMKMWNKKEKKYFSIQLFFLNTKRNNKQPPKVRLELMGLIIWFIECDPFPVRPLSPSFSSF